MSRSESELKSKRPLSWVRFYSRVFSDVVKLSWERTDFTAAALGLVIPLLIHFLPGKEAALLPLLWKLPVGVFIGVAAMRLVMAPYVLYRDQYLARETIENDLQKQIDVERAKLQQPDVALIWEWLADEKRTQDMLERTEKHILFTIEAMNTFTTFGFRQYLLGPAWLLMPLPKFLPMGSNSRWAVGMGVPPRLQTTSIFSDQPKRRPKKNVYTLKSHMTEDLVASGSRFRWQSRTRRMVSSGSPHLSSRTIPAVKAILKRFQAEDSKARMEQIRSPIRSQLFGSTVPLL